MLRSKIIQFYNRLMQKNANILFASILDTPPIHTNPLSDTIVYCALGKTSCRQYISAIKSLLRFHNDFMIVAQSDGTLNAKCIQEIKHHLKGAIVLDAKSMFDTIRNNATDKFIETAPTFLEYHQYTAVKITYLKFFNVIFRFSGHKVIIIDSDLLFLKRPDYIIDWSIKPYKNDFYSEGSNEKASDFYSIGFDFNSLDVANFSSGTIGIGGLIYQEELTDILARIRTYNPLLFYTWEIEQALWSIVMAKRNNPVNIDSLRPMYIGSGWRSYNELKQKAIIAHFAGAVRFNRLKYLRCLKDILADLK